MTTKDEALKMAIEFIHKSQFESGGNYYVNRDKTVQACKEALEQPTTQEPVASRFKLSDGNYSLHNNQYDFGEPLYTHPAPSCNCKDKK